jgi:DNA repair protein RadB
MIFEPMNLEQQHMSIQEASKIAARDLGLIVLDSATSLYRVLLESDDNRPVRRLLSVQLSELQELARKHRIPVVITNQVYTEIETGALRPLGGTLMEHLCKAIISLEKIGDGLRRDRIVTHRSQPEGKTAEFRITAKGVE